MNRPLAAPILLIGLAMAAVIVVFSSGSGPLRVALGLYVTVVAPGWAALRLLRLPMSPLTSVTTVVAISVSIDIVLSLALFYARWWSIELATTILLLTIVVLVLADLPMVRDIVARWVPARPSSDPVQQ